jgi:hypothetical protein
MRPGAFAAAVAGRYCAARQRFNRPSFVLLGSRRPSRRDGIAGARHVHHHRSVRVVLNSIVHAAPLPARLVTRTVQRTITATRVEHRVPVPARVTAGAASTQGIVVKRSSPSEGAQKTQAVPRLEIKPSRERFQVQPQAAPVARPPLELERVTDHVLKSLDRRMTSWRERRGKS